MSWNSKDATLEDAICKRYKILDIRLLCHALFELQV